jgi:hypothetical protein
MSRFTIPKPRVVLLPNGAGGHCYFCGKDFEAGTFINETCPKCKVKAVVIERK